MTLPVSSYEELLVQVRGLTHETILLQRQLSSDLFENDDPTDLNHNLTLIQKNFENGKLLNDSRDFVFRKCENNRKIDFGQNSIGGHRLQTHLEEASGATCSIQSGELTARLIAWRDRQCHQPTSHAVPYERSEQPPTSFSAAVLAVAHGAPGPPSASPPRPPLAQAPAPASTEPQSRCAKARAYSVARPLQRTASKLINKEDVMEPEQKEADEHKSGTPSPELFVSSSKRYNEDGSSEDEGGPSTCSRTQRLSSLYHGTWPVERGMWNSQQLGLTGQQSTSTTVHNDMASVMSFSSSVGVGCTSGMQGQRRLGAKVDVVYSLLGMLGGAEGREDMSATLLSMSNSIDSCLAMRQSGCLPLLVQLIHAPGQDPGTRERASQALHNIVHSRGDERAGRREARVLRLLEQLRDYCQTLRTTLESRQPLDESERHPGPTIAALMKLSFDEAHRHAMCQLGGLHAVAELIEMDHAAHGSECDDQNCVTLRRYAGMALTNLTFGDGNNKALLCSFMEFMRALVAQLRSPSDDLRQVTASVLRNLSWRADSSSKQTLREVGAVSGLTKAAMEGRKESTLKSILSALWNLSAHCSTNKVDICSVEGALAFLVDMLSYKAPSKTLAIVENAGGILRNVSSHVAVREDYRAILRERGCLQVLLRQLRSPSLTVVSNACGALWNLSARCTQDQRLLWDLGAVPMLRSLVHSKHKMISMGSSAALKNLLSARPGSSNLVHLDSTARGLGLPTLPTLVARRQRALEQEIDQNLAETCDNIEPSTSPTNKEDKFAFKVERGFGDLNPRSGNAYPVQNTQPGSSHIRYNAIARSESRESVRSVTSTHSDTIFERVNRHVLNGKSPTEAQLKQQSSSLHSAVGFNAAISSEGTSKGPNADRKYVLRYKNTITERQKPLDSRLNEISDLRCTTSTMSWASAADQESACSQILLHSSLEDSLSLSKPNQSSIIEEGKVNPSVCEETKTSNFTEPHFQNLAVKTAVNSSMFAMSRNKNDVAFEEVPNGYSADLSRKYAEENSLHKHKFLNEVLTALLPESDSHDHSPKGDLFGDYAETDLDQPTDYSLRYAERNIDEDDKQNSRYFAVNEQEYVHEDTVKTYCTEGTPYQTPFNFSRAESVSDLHVDSSKAGDSFKKTPEKCNDLNEEEEYANFDPITVQQPNSLQMMTNKHQTSAHSLGSMPVVQHDATDEGLTAELVPVVSDETIVRDARQNVETTSSSNAIVRVSKATQGKDGSCATEINGKTLTLEAENHPAEQTPLMFSRCSSLGSLSGFEQHSIPDDRSSVVSDFSRRTSGIVSPSEFPDSPTQMILASSLHRKSQSDFVSRVSDEVSRPNLPHPSGNRPNTAKCSVFEDGIAAFKEESTPIEFSAATSLSSLKIDDEPKIANDSECEGSTAKLDASILEKHELVISARTDAVSVSEAVDQVSDGDDDDEDLLAACINIGMQNNRHRQSFRRSSLQKAPQPVTNLARYQTSTALNQVETSGTLSPTAEPTGFRIPNTNLEAMSAADTVHNYCTEDTVVNSISFIRSTTGDAEMIQAHKPLEGISVDGIEFSDNEINLARENKTILAESIQYGISQTQPNIPPPSSLPVMKKPDSLSHALPGYANINTSLFKPPSHVAGKETETSTFATENSPCNSSIVSELSDVTLSSLEGSTVSNLHGLQEQTLPTIFDTPIIFSTKDTPMHISHVSSLSSLQVEDEEGDVTIRPKIQNMIKQHIWGCSETQIQDNKKAANTCGGNTDGNISMTGTASSISDGMVTALSPNGSMTSLSSETFGSVEQSEQALLRLCIHSSVPKNAIIDDQRKSTTISVKMLCGVNNYDTTDDISDERDMSKTPCAENTPITGSQEDIQGMNTSRDAISSEIDPILAAVERAAVLEDGSKQVEEEEYRRQRDPDAMIASLDRLTATLVQQSEAMRERDSSAMKQSVISDTWNEDSPNDVSFPSISVSAPLIASFKSDNQEDLVTAMPELVEEDDVIMQTAMTDSRIIEFEANKLAQAVDAEASRDLDFDGISMTSIDIDAIKPPSMMGSLVSLTASLVGPFDNSEISIGRDRCHSTSLPPMRIKGQNVIECRNSRKKSLPAGVVAKRALSHIQNHTGSLENLMNECSISQLENVKPPSMMDELLDAGDMENSMVSVASITSEVADAKDQDSNSLTASDPLFDLLKPVANVLSITCMRFAESMQISGNNSLSECLENINPPSLFNEVSEMDESTMEAATDTLCSDTLCIDNDLQTEELPHPITINRIEEVDNDTDDGAMSIHTDYCVSSSAESTPKKRHNINNLTPKQKRQLAKERYKTYTIAAEMVKKEEEERRKQEYMDSGTVKYTGGKLSPFSKLTPKQRRQEDRARFQTQVLNNPLSDLCTDESNEYLLQQQAFSRESSGDEEESGSPVKSGIPMFRKLPVSKTIKQKRAENKDRFRTRTLNDDAACDSKEDSRVTDGGSRESGYVEALLSITPEEMETMLEKNANIVLNTLNETNSRCEPNGDEVPLDCETLSLVSNDSESERSLKMRFANGISKRLLKTNLRQPSPIHISAPRFANPKLTTELENSGAVVKLAQQSDSQECSESESDNESNCADEQPPVVRGPRIIKPGTISRDASVDSNATDKSETESPKAIRGKRRALYSNPNTRKSTPQSSPLKQASVVTSGIPIGRSHTSPVVRATRATTLRQSNNSSTREPQKSSSSTKIALPGTIVEKRARSSVTIGNRTSLPQKGTTTSNNFKSVKRHSTPPSAPSNAQQEDKKEAPIKPLERQGTFTKDEPEVVNAPTVLSPSSPSKSRIAKPIKSSPTRMHPAAGKSKISTRVFHSPHQANKLTKAASLDKDQTKGSTPPVALQRRSLVGSSSGIMKNSPSNQSLQSNEGGKIVKRLTTLGQRSNSNSSIVSNSSSGVQGRRTAKEATSKIANLWKRVEESKTKQRFEKNDTRHWITPTNGITETDTSVVTSKPPTFRLIRSSTFEGVPKDVDGGTAMTKPKTKRQSKVMGIQNSGIKYRNSCDLSGMSIAEAPCKIPVKFSDSRLTTNDTIQIGGSTVVLRKHHNPEQLLGEMEVDPMKRVSRVGSFIRGDPLELESTIQTQSNTSARTPASAIVPPFNYNPKQTSPLQTAKPGVNEFSDKIEASECQMEITTGSMRVTTV